MAASALVATGALGFALLHGGRAEEAALALGSAEDRVLMWKDAVTREAELLSAGESGEEQSGDILDAWAELETLGVLGVLERVEQHAREAGVECADVSRQAGEIAERVVYRITGGGPAGGVAAFLAMLEGDAPLSLVTRLRITAGESGRLNFDLSVTMFTEGGKG